MASPDSNKKSQITPGDRARLDALIRIRTAQSADVSAEHWAERIHHGERDALSQAITLAESQKIEDLQFLDQVLLALREKFPKKESQRIGITGVPGVGKSTFIEQLGNAIIHENHRLAVLAIDPSSGRSGGSILGDKTRMETLSRAPNAFVRPSPTADTLGGVTRGTFEAIELCEAAGFDRIIVETVGVGQSETAVRDLTDVFILLMLPGGGDELQGIKRGIMEMADLLLVNKCDSGREPLAQETAMQYRKALHLFPPNMGGHDVHVQTVSALNNDGINSVMNHIQELVEMWQANGWLNRQRSEQRMRQFENQIRRLSLLKDRSSAQATETWNALVNQVTEGTLSPLNAAHLWHARRQKNTGP